MHSICKRQTLNRFETETHDWLVANIRLPGDHEGKPGTAELSIGQAGFRLAHLAPSECRLKTGTQVRTCWRSLLCQYSMHVHKSSGSCNRLDSCQTEPSRSTGLNVPLTASHVMWNAALERTCTAHQGRFACIRLGWCKLLAHRVFSGGS